MAPKTDRRTTLLGIGKELIYSPGLKLLFGLLAGGLIPLRRINVYKDLPTAVLKQRLELGLSEKVD